MENSNFEYRFKSEEELNDFVKHQPNGRVEIITKKGKRFKYSCKSFAVLKGNGINDMVERGVFLCDESAYVTWKISEEIETSEEIGNPFEASDEPVETGFSFEIPDETQPSEFDMNRASKEEFYKGMVFWAAISMLVIAIFLFLGAFGYGIINTRILIIAEVVNIIVLIYSIFTANKYKQL